MNAHEWGKYYRVPRWRTQYLWPTAAQESWKDSKAQPYPYLLEYALIHSILMYTKMENELFVHPF